MAKDGRDLDTTMAMLHRTPATLTTLLGGLPRETVTVTEGPSTWSPLEVVAHLVHAERTNWIPRVRHLLDQAPGPIPAFDRTAHLATVEQATLEGWLEAFEAHRRESLSQLAALQLTSADLDLKGTHPALGEVTLRQLLATWLVHDLTHVQQIVRTIAKAYDEAVGPWNAYLTILRDRR